MLKQITAQQVIDRVITQSGSTWKDPSTDIFLAGDPNTLITGIATSFTPSIEVLKKAVATGNNLIITQQSAYYSQTESYMLGDPAFQYKKDYIEKNKLVLWRYYDNWNNRSNDRQLAGLAKALGWDKYHIHYDNAPPYAKPNKYFNLPASTLQATVAEFKKKLNIPALRVIGNPAARITKAALSHDMFKLTELQEILKDPEINLIVIAEAIEWEACEYFRDVLTWKGQNKAMILLGREAAEDPGYKEMASSLSTVIKEVPVTWIPASEPFWVV
jgi:putative NIF3 family GTP cyclohydrolase 1 type 2